MANTHDLFQIYNQAIKLSESDRQTLIQARNSLRNRMKNAYSKFSEEDRRTHTLDFQSQGSFVMDTIIKPIQEDFDLDDGIYFKGNLLANQRPETKFFHDIVIRAIDRDNVIEEIVDKPTCVRVIYKNPRKGNDTGFHIDLPIYYAENFETPELAHKDEGWVESNPVEFIGWFEDKTKSGFSKSYLYEQEKYFNLYEKWLSDIRKKDCQLRRIVRYLKSWADLKKKDMPCGIVMTIFAANNYFEDERDDISLNRTLKNILGDLNRNNFTCLRPTPKTGEDLLKNKTVEEKDYFRKSLESFISSSDLALNNPNPKDACLKWKIHLGDRFPCHLAKNEIEGSKTYAVPPIKQDNSRSAE